MRCRVMPGARMLKIVVMKLIAPTIDEAPAKCSEKITISTEGPGRPPALAPERAGHTVRPAGAPCPITPRPAPTLARPSRQMTDGSSRQHPLVFFRADAM